VGPRAGRDAEEADVEKERAEQAKGPAHRAHELDELAKIYEDRGVSPGLARLVRRRPRPRRGPAPGPVAAPPPRPAVRGRLLAAALPRAPQRRAGGA